MCQASNPFCLISGRAKRKMSLLGSCPICHHHIQVDFYFLDHSLSPGTLAGLLPVKRAQVLHEETEGLYLGLPGLGPARHAVRKGKKREL